MKKIVLCAGFVVSLFGMQQNPQQQTNQRIAKKRKITSISVTWNANTRRFKYDASYSSNEKLGGAR